MTPEQAKTVEEQAMLALKSGTERILDRCLERFVDIIDLELQFCWTHGLSHLLDLLWEKQQINWLTRLHGIALAIGQGLGPNGYQDPNGNWNCFERLPQTMIEKAPFDTDPRTVGLDPEQIDWRAFPYASANLEAALRAMPFGSETERVLFQLSHPGQYEKATYPETLPDEGPAGTSGDYSGDLFRQRLTYLREQGVSEADIQNALAQRPAWLEHEKRQSRY